MAVPSRARILPHIHNVHPASNRFKYGISLGSCQHSKQPCGFMAKSHLPNICGTLLGLAAGCETLTLLGHFILKFHWAPQNLATTNLYNPTLHIFPHQKYM